MCACIETKCCDVPHVIESAGARVCINCGLIESDLCFEQGETFTKDREGRYVKVSERMDQETTYPHSTISLHNKDYQGHPISPAMEVQFQRLRSISKHYVSNEKRNLVLANRIRRRLMSVLGFTDPKNIAFRICQWVASTKFSQGRILEATTAAAIYVAAIEQGFPVTYEQLGGITHVRLNHLRRIVAIYLAGRPAGSKKFPIKFTREKFFLPARAIRKLCDDLRYSPQIASLAEELAQSVEARLPTGARPETKAAVFVNATCGGNIPWSYLSRAAGVQAPSLKEYWKRIEPIITEILHLNSSLEHESQFNLC